MAERLGLHPADLRCVSLLGLESGPHTTGEIAKLTGLTSGSATVWWTGWRGGLVERRPDLHDRRKMLVSLAARRGPEIEAAWEIPGRAFGEALGEFTDEDTRERSGSGNGVQTCVHRDKVSLGGRTGGTQKLQAIVQLCL